MFDQDQLNDVTIPDISDLTPEEREEVCVKAASYGCATYALAIILSLLLCLILGSCRSSEPATVVVVRDSIRTEVRTETIIVNDTVPVALPGDSIAVVTPPDTTSHLETSVAISEATIRDGLLFHSIWNKPTVNVPVQHTSTVRDSIIYREKEVPVPYPVEVEVEKKLSRWQQARLHLANVVLLCLALAALVWLIRKRAWWLRLLRKAL